MGQHLESTDHSPQVLQTCRHQNVDDKSTTHDNSCANSRSGYYSCRRIVAFINRFLFGNHFVNHKFVLHTESILGCKQFICPKFDLELVFWQSLRNVEWIVPVDLQLHSGRFVPVSKVPSEAFFGWINVASGFSQKHFHAWFHNLFTIIVCDFKFKFCLVLEELQVNWLFHNLVPLNVN